MNTYKEYIQYIRDYYKEHIEDDTEPLPYEEWRIQPKEEVHP